MNFHSNFPMSYFGLTQQIVIKLEIFENTIKNNKNNNPNTIKGIKSYRINPNDKKLNAKVIVKVNYIYGTTYI